MVFSTEVARILFIFGSPSGLRRGSMCQAGRGVMYVARTRRDAAWLAFPQPCPTSFPYLISVRDKEAYLALCGGRALAKPERECRAVVGPSCLLLDGRF